MTWGNSDLFRSAGQTWNYRSKPKVRKTVGAWQPWTVTNHVFGPRRFYTWQEAMEYPATSSEANRASALRAAKLASDHLQAADAAAAVGDSSRYWRNMSAVFGLQYPYPAW